MPAPAQRCRYHQHVTGGHGADEQLLGIVPAGITTKGRSRGSFNRSLAARCDQVVAAVGPITRGAGAAIAGPTDLDCVRVLLAHLLILAGQMPWPGSRVGAAGAFQGY